MPCGHAACIFAAALNEADCQRLCEICRIKRFYRSQTFIAGQWKDYVVLTLEGVLLDMRQINEDHPITVAIHAPGALLGLENIFAAGACVVDETRSAFCLTECQFAVFPAMEMRNLIRKRPEFLHPILKDSVLCQLNDQRDMLTYLGFGDAKTSVSYVMDYLNAHGLNSLTHEQIAIICNRSRQTVTTALNQLQNKMPNT